MARSGQEIDHRQRAEVLTCEVKWERVAGPEHGAGGIAQLARSVRLRVHLDAPIDAVDDPVLANPGGAVGLALEAIGGERAIRDLDDQRDLGV